MRNRGLFWLLLLCMPLSAAPVFAADAAPQQSDVRVLIDISGSMRKNDPNNLRRPALRMLAGLLQPGTRAGVWTFARWVNNLVPVAEVDAAWKQRTQSLSKKIASPGQFTNIEEVLDQASRDWSGEPTTHARHLVLLTDGMVDVSKNPDDNAQSRERILDTLLPRLVATGVKVHTIALSERADHELMKRLAGETGGWYEQVGEADALQRTFLKMFESVGKPDSVPLQDNRFTVDGSINEATVLVFSKPDSPPAVLRSPSGDEYIDSDLPAGIAWYRDKGYDLVTIANPQKGEWSVQADIDPDNRVMIVTDLKLQTSEMPAHLAVGEEVHVEAHLSNRGKLVDRQAFLRLLEVRADAMTPDGTEPQALNDAGQEGDRTAGDGRYGMQYTEARPQKSVELLVSVDSPTFMREKRYRLAVHEPAEGSITAMADGLALTIKSNPAVLQPGAQIDVWQQAPGGDKTPLTLQVVDDVTWQAELIDPQLPVYARVSGTSRIGNLIAREIGPILPPGVSLPKPVAEPPAEPMVETAPAEAVAEPQPAAQPPAAEETAPADVADEEAAPDDAEEEAGWLMPAIIFGGVNVVLLIGAAVWFILRRRRGVDKSDELDLDDLVAEPAPSVGEDGDTQEEAA